MRYSIIYVHEDIMEVKKKKANTIGFEFNLTMRFLSITTRTKPEFYYHHRNEITENQVKQQHQQQRTKVTNYHSGYQKAWQGYL